ncbi:GDSL-type esterase/lipase family protein [Amycolatopsis thermalba]|uniref:GDSL-type esterase/lipase family protein n=1 Tax=Amycolatopsis thermalba TaxID=944492 RepID=A0ABY4NS47_9PSEU|nr:MULTISPECIES: GDSL-type esterase/lipase family protein [Amycolatopsis]UQS22872.1 GDSL-type esterase/lipase family protein [Amycolatopsis thermalba]
MGADGNIYALTQAADGTHLIGLAPNLASGQTQPTKVRDFKVSADCDYVLRPYKDGIALSYPHVDDRPKYYSYSGKYLGQASIGDWGSDAFGAEGRFFSPAYTWSGSNVKSAAVSMYDPRKGTTTWTTPVSTPGANVQGSLQLHTINNGVVAIIYEWKMVSDYIPVTPTEWVFTVVTLDNNGHEVRRVTLPNQDAQGTYQAASLASVADASGKVAFLRNMNLSTGDSANPTASGIFVGVYDAVSGTWFYQKIMSGDMSKAGGPNGYYLSGPPPVLTNNILAFVAQCDGNCSDYNPKLYAVKMTGIGMDYPRGAILSATVSAQPAPRSYMALGDSFSSGEGVPPFVDDTACHRSALAYSRVNALNPSLTLQLDKFVACSGAQTTHVLNGWNDADHSEPSQASVLSSGSPKVVTITIGGNDIGFANFAKACVLGNCNSSSAAYTEADGKIRNVLQGTWKRRIRSSWRSPRLQGQRSTFWATHRSLPISREAHSVIHGVATCTTTMRVKSALRDTHGQMHGPRGTS